MPDITVPSASSPVPAAAWPHALQQIAAWMFCTPLFVRCNGCHFLWPRIQQREPRQLATRALGILFDSVCETTDIQRFLRRYDMTGETGSYRYMAPEVFRHEPYNSKVTSRLSPPSRPPALLCKQWSARCSISLQKPALPP